MSSDPIAELLANGPVAVNLGLHEFAETVAAQGADVIHVDWRPPETLDPDLEALLEKLG